MFSPHVAVCGRHGDDWRVCRATPSALPSAHSTDTDTSCAPHHRGHMRLQRGQAAALPNTRSTGYGAGLGACKGSGEV